MAFSLTKQQKYGISALSCLAILLFLLWPGAENGLESQPAPEVPARSAAKAEPRIIQNVQTAISVEELHNPFSWGHEQRGQIISESSETNSPVQEHRDKNKVAEHAVPLSDTETSKKLPAVSLPPALELRGVFYGETGSFVILAAGGKSASLAQGESFAGWQVQVIHEQGVWVEGPEGRKYLTLAHAD